MANPNTVPRDITDEANAALAITGYYEVPDDCSVYTIAGVIVPPGGHFDGKNRVGHVPANAAFGIQLAGIGSTASRVNLICDLPANLISPQISPTLQTMNLPTGILMYSGAKAYDIRLDYFGIGIQSFSSPGANPPYAAESFVKDFSINNSINTGIDWEGPTDSYLIHGVVSRNTAGTGDGSSGAGNGLIGIKFGSSAGFIRDVHVWGAHKTGVQLTAQHQRITGLEVEGARGSMLQIGNWYITVLDCLLFYPIGSGISNAIEYGIAGVAAGQFNNVTATIGKTGGFAYNQIVKNTSVNGNGNATTLYFEGTSGWPALSQITAQDKLTGAYLTSATTAFTG